MAHKQVLPRSDLHANLNPKLNPTTPSISPSTPLKYRHHQEVLGLLTPVASVASFSPTTSSRTQPRTSSSPALFFPRTVRSSRRLSLRQSLPRSSPTLALSVHSQPSASSKMQVASRPSSPYSRPQSPKPDYIPRPPSRSEFLLRETLRRVEDYEQSTSRSPSNRRQPVARAKSYRGPEFADGECECGEDPYLHPSKQSGSFDFFREPGSTAPRLVCRSSSRASRSPEDPHYVPYGSPSSPSPLPPAFVRTRTAPAMPSTAKAPCDQGAALSVAPQRPRQGRPSRHSMPNTTGNGGPSPGSHSRQSSVETSPPFRPVALSPHEAVLRARLEGVLMRAGVQGGEDANARLNLAERDTHVRSKSHSVSIVRGQSLHRDWPSTSGTSSDSLSASTPSSDLSKSKSSLSDREQNQAQALSPSLSLKEPITPPPSPPFDARSASEVCKRMDGYVSFACVEGLGEPPEMDVDIHEDEHSKPWARWWRVWPFATGGTTVEQHLGTTTRGVVGGEQRPASR